MKKLLTPELKTELEVLKRKLLFVSRINAIFVIHDYKIETLTETKTTGFFKKKKEEIKTEYITSLELWTYNSKGKFLGVMNENATEDFIGWYNLYSLRQNFENLKEELAAFGYEIVPIKKEENEKSS